MNTVKILKTEQQTHFCGNDVLNLDKGCVVKVISTPSRTPDAESKILIRTASREHPFVGIDTGELWGDDIHDYEFLLINVEEINIKER